MWGREMRVGLVFVLVSLLAGSAFREWKRSHETRFADLIADLESRDAAPRVPTPGPGAADSPWAEDGGSRAGPKDDGRAGRAGVKALIPARIDIDRATARELERLPGIGPMLAARIVADRDRNGPFRDASALLRVPGIGPRTLARIRPYLASASADSGSPIAN